MSAPTSYRQLATYIRELREESLELYEIALEACQDHELEALLATWQLSAHRGQLREHAPEPDRPIWLVQAGRGFGKTRCASEYALDTCEDWGPAFRGILCNKTIGDVRDVMIDGASGLKACAERRGYSIKYIPSQSKVVHPCGGVFYLCSSEQPEKPRGYQSNFIWGDEIAAWRHAIQTFDNLMYGWRLPVKGGRPLMCLTTTPRPNPIMFRLARDPVLKDQITITRGRTIDNQRNLDATTVAVLLSVYDGTRSGRQELDGELLETFGAVVEQDVIAEHRLAVAPELSRRVVALDPSITANEDSDAAGIVVVGSDDREAPHGYLLDDRSLEQATFNMWARRSVEAFDDWNCDCIVAEVNQGGGGIREAIDVAAVQISQERGRTIIPPVRSIWAKESKKARAEPIGALYERGRIHHVGQFREAEKELTSWVPGMDSPNRMDALVHGFAHLLLGDKPEVGPISTYFS